MTRCIAISGRILALVLTSAVLLHATPARAVLDIHDRGPALTSGNFTLRVTNAGILGNAFLDVGLSNDPSFECPPGSGFEMLNNCALWVGGRDETGLESVSGGPVLEFRPTLAADDVVRMASFGRLGAVRFADDDNDGRVDEEVLNDRDDDGDGEVDEDLGLYSQQYTVADYVDDRPEAVNFVYPGGERHRPLGLSVHQEAFAWSVPGYEKIAGLSFSITNHGLTRVRDLYVGLYADLDARNRTDRAGHVNDRVTTASYSQTFFEGNDSTTVAGIHLCPGGPGPCPGTRCFTTLSQTVPVVVDGVPGSGLPVAAVVPLWHTTDPLGNVPLLAQRGYVRAPEQVRFTSSVFEVSSTPGQGGAPVSDANRYLAMQDRYPESNRQSATDYAVLVSCGPFDHLDPGQTIEFHAALVWGENLDSLRRQIANAAIIERGIRFNRQPDYVGPTPKDYDRGETGINGHEVCLEAPEGLEFDLDKDCARKYPEEWAVPDNIRHYVHGQCIWTDLDCDGCTGLDGNDVAYRWNDPGTQAPAPGYAAVPADHQVMVQWDNMPEILLNAGLAGFGETRFLGYRLWKLYDWRVRPSLVPEQPRWSLAATFGPDTSFGGRLLTSVTDSSVDYERILFEQKQYPIGRYKFVDREVQNGFDYIFVVTTVYESRIRESDGYLRIRQSESPLDADFGKRVVPHASATPNGSSVWVVPNPFRGSAEWDRPPTYGDELTRHIDFMGLPQAQCTIKVWTVAGDFVAQIVHDGRNGDGQVSWNLVSRNGQDIVSGIYLFSVDSSLGHQTGRFVVVR